MRPLIRMRAYDYDRSAAHGAQWQELELILRRLLQHGNTHERRERVVYASLRPAEALCACMRPTKAACFRIWKCANKRQLIVAGIQRFLRWAYTLWHYTARFHVIDTRKTLRVLRVYTQQWLAYYLLRSVLIRWMPSLNNRSKLKGECIEVKSGCLHQQGLLLTPSLS